jgi:hypothetical protein
MINRAKSVGNKGKRQALQGGGRKREEKKDKGEEKERILESKARLDEIERMVADEEKRLMFICDLRRTCECKRMVSVPSVVELPHSSSNRVLSQKEGLICFMLTPRVVLIMMNNRKFRVLMNLIPDEMRFSLEKEKYLLECKELGKKGGNCQIIVFLCELDEIESVQRMGNVLKIDVRKQIILITFNYIEDCKKYLDGLSLLI